MTIACCLRRQWPSNALVRRRLSLLAIRCNSAGVSTSVEPLLKWQRISEAVDLSITPGTCSAVSPQGASFARPGSSSLHKSLATSTQNAHSPRLCEGAGHRKCCGAHSCGSDPSVVVVPWNMEFRWATALMGTDWKGQAGLTYWHQVQQGWYGCWQVGDECGSGTRAHRGCNVGRGRLIGRGTASAAGWV